MSVASLYQTTLTNQNQLQQSVQLLATQQKETAKYRDEFERQRGRCKQLADQLTAQLADNDTLKLENQDLYKQLAQTGQLDNDARYNDNVAINTEMKNLKDVIKQQHDTIQFLKQRKITQVSNGD